MDLIVFQEIYNLKKKSLEMKGLDVDRNFSKKEF